MDQNGGPELRTIRPGDRMASGRNEERLTILNGRGRSPARDNHENAGNRLGITDAART